MDETTIWRIGAMLVFGIAGALWTMQRAEIKSLKEDVKHLSNSRYTKLETEQQIILRVDPLKEHMEEMRSDIKDIKKYLLSGNKDG